jgi:flagellar biosynthesis protein FlhB
MAESNGEKSHDPTPHRRQQAREEGHVVNSQDLSSAVLLLGGLLVLLYCGAALVEFFGRLIIKQLGGQAWLVADQSLLMMEYTGTGLELAKFLLPVLGLTMLIALAANVFQVGLLFLPEKAAPDLSRLDPLAGLGRLFSLSNVMKLLFGIFKIGVIVTVAFSVLYHRRDEVIGLAALDLPQIALFVWDVVFWTALKIGFALFVLAVLDYGYQRWKHEKDLKMTQQEIREEMRNLQGDPQVISRRKSVQRQLAMNRISSTVPKADVVITNPTELAIAIQYDPETMNAPVVIAKGAGVVAQKIRRLALEHGVPIVERKPLAQALYKEVDLNRPIPDQLYSGVAEVLAYVYQLKGKTIPGAKSA